MQGLFEIPTCGVTDTSVMLQIPIKILPVHIL